MYSPMPGDGPFWVVWCPESGPPTKRHDRKTDAIAEARRLATNNPGRDFFVLCTVSRSRRMEPVETVEFDIFDAGVPF